MAMMLSPRDGSLTSRGLGSSRRSKSHTGPKTTDFLRLVERAEDAFTATDDTIVEDVRRILADVRTQYDQVHNEAEKKEAELIRMRESIRVADKSNNVGTAESSKKEDMRSSIEKQHAETLEQIKDAQTAKKVYNHMCGRIQKEQGIMKEKILAMEAHLDRKNAESHRKVAVQDRRVRKNAETAQELDVLEQEMEHERVVRDEAQRKMANTLNIRREAKDRRTKFDEWRREVALDAANEAFNASAGRLRKLYAVEKLAGNSLQKTTFEQVERSQNTEDGFQKIREVTGLTDVMDIVHKFLNRDVEHEQLKSSVKEAEIRLESLQEQFDRAKRNANGLTFDMDPGSRMRGLHVEVEEHEAKLNQVLKEHEKSKQKLQQTTLQVEHMRLWAKRVTSTMPLFEECIAVDKPADLPIFFQQMQRVVDKLISHVVQQISSCQIQGRTSSQASSRESQEARRLLEDRDFLKVNCRVPASLDLESTVSRVTTAQTAEEDPQDLHHQERARCKNESTDRVSEAQRKAEHEKRRRGLRK